VSTPLQVQVKLLFAHRVLFSHYCTYATASSVLARLSKVIAKRWKRLSDRGKEFYRDVARTDQERHEQYLAAVRQSQGRPIQEDEE
jgi:hypothetical protein